MRQEDLTFSLVLHQKLYSKVRQVQKALRILKHSLKRVGKNHYEVWQKIIIKCDRHYKVLQEVITKCDRYYKKWQLLRSERVTELIWQLTHDFPGTMIDMFSCSVALKEQLLQFSEIWKSTFVL